MNIRTICKDHYFRKHSPQIYIDSAQRVDFPPPHPPLWRLPKTETATKARKWHLWQRFYIIKLVVSTFNARLYLERGCDVQTRRDVGFLGS